MDPRPLHSLEDGCLQHEASRSSHIPQRGQEKGAYCLALLPSAALQPKSIPVALEPTTVDTARYRNRSLSLSQSSPRSASSRCFSPSPSSTPTTYSFGPTSPTSPNSGFQSPPLITGFSFCHSRESSLDDTMSKSKKDAFKNFKADFFSNLKSFGRKKGGLPGPASEGPSPEYHPESASEDLGHPVQLHSHGESSIDGVQWRKDGSDRESQEELAPGAPLSENEEDDDLAAYRKEIAARLNSTVRADGLPRVDGSGMIPNTGCSEPRNTSLTPLAPNSPTAESTSSGGSDDGDDGRDEASPDERDGGPEEAYPGNAEQLEANVEDDADGPEEASPGDADQLTPDVEDDTSSTSEQADEIARTILRNSYGLEFKWSEPPKEVVKYFQDCLDNTSFFMERARSLGLLPTTNSPGPPPWHPSASGSLAANPTGSSASNPSGPAVTNPSGSRDSSSSTTVSGTPPTRSSDRRRKRPARGRSHPDEDPLKENSDEDCDAVQSGAPVQRKKAKLDQYPCPFRKRSPLKFNCREWEYCAKAPFKDMTELKKHVRKYHRQQDAGYQCPRCHDRFAKMEDLHAHLLVDAAMICQAKLEADLPDEETINLDLDARLGSRAEQFDWQKLWRALFPRDTTVPDPVFEPVIELYEVDDEYQTSWAAFEDQLSLTLEMLLSVGPSAPDRDALRYQRQIMSNALENLVREYMASVFERSRARTSSPAKRKPAYIRSTERNGHFQPVSSNVMATGAARPISVASSGGSSDMRPVPAAKGQQTDDRPISTSSETLATSAARPPLSGVSSRRTSVPNSTRSVRSGTRPLRPHPAPRNIDGQSYPSEPALPSSTPHPENDPIFQFGTFFVQKASGSELGGFPQSATLAQGLPRAAITLPSRPAQGSPAPAMPKRRTALQEEGTCNPRDSAITDMGCAACLGGVTCDCEFAHYFDMAYQNDFQSTLDADHFLAQAEINPAENTADPGAWNGGHFPGW